MHRQSVTFVEASPSVVEKGESGQLRQPDGPSSTLYVAMSQLLQLLAGAVIVPV
jgi:hypothetical protein